MKKRLLAGLICICLVAGLTACGNGKKWLFSINGEKLYHKEVMVYGLIFARDYNITNDEQLDELYENGMTYEEYYKEQLEDEIVSTVLIDKEARAEKFSLSKEEKKEIKEKTNDLMEYCGTDWLKKKKISADDISKVLEKKQLTESYIESLSENNTDEAEAARYIKVYQVTFLTVELDENGMMKTNENGEVRRISEEALAEKAAQAEEFTEKIEAGGEIENLVKDYDKTVTGMETYLKYDDLSADYKKEVDSLSKGSVSGVIESAYGYQVIKLLDEDAKEHAEVISDYENKTSGVARKAELFEELYQKYLRDDVNYKNTDRWKNVNIREYIR